MIDPSADRESIDAADIQPLSVDDLNLSGQLTGESGRTYVDDETETVGDGQTSADHETVNAESLGIGDGRTEVREVTAFGEDTDGTTPLSLSISNVNLNAVEEAELVIITEGNGGGSAAQVDIQLGGFASGYRQTTISGASLSNTETNSSFFYDTFNSHNDRRRFDLSVSEFETFISQRTGRDTDDTIMFGRIAETAISPIDVSTSFNCSGRGYVVRVYDG